MIIKILECKLLSVQEARKVSKSLRGAGASYCWWLCSPGDAPNLATDVDFYGAIGTYGLPITNCIGVRPALWLESPVTKSFKLAGHRWINVFDNVYLCENFIGFEIFDEKSNQYCGSRVQNFIIAWCKNHDISFYEKIELDE